jgi:hypothetical protein
MIAVKLVTFKIEEFQSLESASSNQEVNKNLEAIQTATQKVLTNKNATKTQLIKALEEIQSFVA